MASTPAADELADFGAPQLSLTLRVAQAGKRVPWGISPHHDLQPLISRDGPPRPA
jgi:hypothetical protein